MELKIDELCFLFQQQFKQEIQNMGSTNCCEAEKGDHDLILNFNSIKTEDPVEIAVPTTLRKSMNQSTLICRKGYEEGVDGDYISEDPMVTEAVYNRLENLHPLTIHESYFSERGNEVHGYFRFRRTGIVYAGEWKNGIPHGHGKNYYPNGGLYEGTFLEGIPHGYGRFIMPSGDYFQGEVKFGRANGSGSYDTDNSTYKGTFKDNVKHGQGEEKGQSFFFRGEYEYGEKKKGLLKFNGNVYEGLFVDGLFSGKAKLTTSEGQYTGEFKEGEQHGYGEFRWLDGSVYRGNYYRGEREGSGEYYSGKNSSISKGMWKKGKLNGEGSYTEPRGETFKCVWQNGKISAIIEN